MPRISLSPPTNWLASNKAVRAVLIAFFGVAVAWSFAGTINNPTCQDRDFGAYYRAAVAVREGRTPYVVDQYGPMGVYPYAPAFAYSLIPLTYLDYRWACRCWMMFNWLATAASFILAIRLLAPENGGAASRQFSRLGERGCVSAPSTWGADATPLAGRRATATPFADPRVILLALVPLTAYLWTNLHVGQAAMFMVLGCLAWAYCQRQGNRFLGGMFLAAASALKLAPLAFVPYLVIQRDRRGWVGFLAGSALLFALPAAWIGWTGTCDLHLAWFEHTAATQVPVQTYRPGNQSLLAQLARLPPFSNGHEYYSAQRLCQLEHVYPFVLAGVGALLYAWILWDRRRLARVNGSLKQKYSFLSWERERRNRPGRPSCDPLHLALLLVFLTLSNPRAWRCNFVALLFPCLMLAKQVWRRAPGYRMGLAALGIVLLACAVPTHGLGEQGWNLGRWLLEGKHFWGGVAVGGACWWTSRCPSVKFTKRIAKQLSCNQRATEQAFA